MQADKAASGSARLFPVAVFVIGVNQLKLGLFGVGAERIASIQGFKALDSNREAVAIECGACQLIQLALLYPANSSSSSGVVSLLAQPARRARLKARAPKRLAAEKRASSSSLQTSLNHRKATMAISRNGRIGRS